MDPHQRSRQTDRAIHVAVIGAIATVIVGIIPYVVVTSGNNTDSGPGPTVATTSVSPDPPPTPEATDSTTAPPEVGYLDVLVDLCAAGDLDACDELYLNSPVGSDYEWIGATCGLRLPNPVFGDCWLYA